MRNRFVYIALVLSLIILVWLGRIYITKNRLQMQYTKDVERTYQVIIALHNCEQLLADAETNHRGYLLTRSDVFREFYDQYLSKADSAVNQLEKMTADNPSQRVNLKLLRPAIRERIIIMQDNITLTGKEPDYTERLKKGKFAMDKVRFYTDMMEKEEYSLLKYRNQEKFRYQELNFSFLTYTFFFACLVCIAAILLILRELRMRIRSQKMLEQSLFELRQSNDEFEQVSFAVSHDLQEPLRKIRTLSTLLTKKYGEHLGAEEKDVLSRMDRSTERMHGLLDNLIDFTNLINRSEKFVPVSLDKCFRQALAKVTVNTEAELIMHAELPVIRGFEQQLVLLFSQLLSNSIQYKHPDRKVVFEVDYAIVDTPHLRNVIKKGMARQYYRVTIKDNGIGFDNVFQERIFVLFQRLHSQNEYNGKGIGLTIARRIMTNHYGYIEASGVKDEGASFTLYFPV
jgi:signal transduction histidine kinase